MNLLSAHSKDSNDAYQRPTFSRAEKTKRVVWLFVSMLLFRHSPIPLHNWRSFILRCFGAKIGSHNFIYPSCKIWAPWNLETEDVVTLGPGVEVYNPANFKLGHHTIISQNAYLCGATHDFNSADFDYIAKPIVAGPYAWVCARAIVLPGVTLGDGSVLGAGSVASKDLDSWAVYAGNPAVKVSDRNKFLGREQ